MSCLFQHYCDVTESLAFRSSQINSSSEYSNSNSKSIRTNKLKCFNCFGVQHAQNLCCHCGGTSYVTDSHPLALLLNQVLERKMGKGQPHRQTPWNDLQDVEAIREQLDERKIICDLCDKQCDINYKYYCQSCECFYVCEKCAEIKGNQIEHQHPLSTNKCMNSITQLGIKRTNSKKFSSNKKNSYTDIQDQNYLNHKDENYLRIKNSKNSKKSINDISQNLSEIIDQEILNFQDDILGCMRDKQENILGDSYTPHYSRVLDSVGIQIRQSYDFICGEGQSLRQSEGCAESFGVRQSFGFGQQSLQRQVCDNCGFQLKDLYCVCRTCQRKNNVYKLCHNCHDQNLHSHDQSHKLEAVLGNLLGRGSIFKSKLINDQSEEEQTCDLFNLKRKSSSIQKIPYSVEQSPLQKEFSGKKSFTKLKYSMNYRRKQLDFEPKQKKKQFDEESKVQVDCGSLYSSSQLKDQLETIGLVHKKSSLYEVNNSIQSTQKFREIQQKAKKQIEKQFPPQEQQPIKITFVNSQAEQSQQEGSPQLKFSQKSLKNTQKGSKKDKIRSSQRLKSFKSHNLFHGASQQKVESQIHEQSDALYQIQRNSQQVIESPETISKQRDYQSTFTLPQKSSCDDYIFHQYTCDQCGCSPIKNVKYHCQECEDFDVCGDCYGLKFQMKHPHLFQKTDGKKKMQQKKAMLLQRKDLNKGRQGGMMRNYNMNLSILAKSKKTIDIIKRGVNTMNTSVSNISKSINSSIDFNSQKLSIKGNLKYF